MSDDPMGLLDEAATYVAATTGVRQLFIASGWSPDGAEMMVVEMCRLAVAKVRAGQVGS